MSAKKELAAVTKGSTALALPADINFSADMDNFGANYSADQLAMPFLNILQALSPQVTRGKNEYLPEARAGQLYNTVTKDLYDGEKGLNVILSTFKESYIEWVPRNQGGGFVAEYDAAQGVKAKTAMDDNFNQVIQPGSSVGTPGNFLSLTHTRLGAVLNDELTSWSPVIISMSASGLKVSRNINSRHKLMEWINPSTGLAGPIGKLPMPLILWTAKTKMVSNDQGSWFTWDFEKKSFLSELPQEQFLNLYRGVRDFASSSKGQKIMEEAAEASVTNNHGGVTIDANTVNSDMPF